jgi:hypothetical protein
MTIGWALMAAAWQESIANAYVSRKAWPMLSRGIELFVYPQTFHKCAIVSSFCSRSARLLAVSDRWDDEADRF